MLSRTSLFIWLAVLAAVGVGVGIFSVYGSRPNHTVKLVFTAKVGDALLDFNKFAYTNPAGSEKFRIRNFRFYISNVKLYGEEGEYVEEESYHLARFDSSNKSYAITLRNVPLSEVRKIALSIGVDAKANTSIKAVGDLDPNSQMAWNWQVGYKFVLLEGSIRVDGQVRPLVYHVGFNENRRDVMFSPPQDIDLNGDESIQFTVDIMKIFTGGSTINMVKLPSVKFDKKDAQSIADNYKVMISANWK
ncbi:MAG: hypothetical protein ACI9R3_006485 [Verrucomicrobiales bacterium]|jgi:hypothetical protein